MKKTTQNNKKNIKDTEKKAKKVKVIEEVEEVKEEPKKVKKEKLNKDKIEKILYKIDDNRKYIFLFIIGFLVATLLFRGILWPDRIATLKDGTQPIAKVNGKNITADDLYTSMKKQYKAEIFVNDIDKLILEEKYPETDEMKEEVNQTANYYYQVYETNYGRTKEQFLSNNGFATENDFLDFLMLNTRRNKYYEEYAKSLVSDKDVEKYYENEVFGDVDSEHMLVSIKRDGEEDGLTNEEAKALAEEIIKKLNDGSKWEDIVNEYKDKITHEKLGYQAFNASLESSYLKECKDLAVGSYSKTPVLTSYGYHIVYKKDQKEKAKLETVKEDIIELLANEKKNADQDLLNKALVHLREEAKLEFTDTKLKEEYEKLIKDYK